MVEVIEKHALDRYGLTELVTDKETLEKLEPNMDLLKTLLTFRGHLQGEVLQTARRIIRQVVEEIKRKLEAEVRRALSGRLNRFRHSPQKAAQNFDWRGTIRRNLKLYDAKRQQIVLQDPALLRPQHPAAALACHPLRGPERQHGRLGHSQRGDGGHSCRAAARAGELVVFDTSVVDLSEHVDDPVEVLMSVQLGGGTNIGAGAELLRNARREPAPHRAGAGQRFLRGRAPRLMLGTCRRLREGGVKLLGLASLDQSASPIYDQHMAEQLAETGMEIAALTPKHFAEWLAKVINSK